MSKQPLDLNESIQLAIDAASAASDGAEEITGLRSEVSSAVERLDSLGKTVKPLMIGTLIGTTLAIALGGAVYLRTLSGMRTVTATQTEALAHFTESVASLNSQLAAFSNLDEALDELATGRQIDEELIKSALSPEFQEVLEAVTRTQDEIMRPSERILTTVVESAKEEHEETRETLTLAIADLQLDLTRVIAGQASVPAQRTAAPPTPSPVVEQPVSKPSKPPTAAPRRKPVARKPEANPFTYP